jgi:tetratricopeptide (TPR) repeat protein/predicted Ser/Thr protein kinase
MRFSHFEFDPQADRLGEGPQSEVFRATDTQLGRVVALKVLRPNVEIDPESSRRFEREAKHTSLLQHPNIATIYEYGQDHGTSYIAMEFLDGRTLDKVLKQRALSADECVRIGLQVAAGLSLVHSKGLIHRDLKPGNVMLLENGQVKLLDFGIARSMRESNITQSGLLVGTVLYMSPEQVRGDELDVRSDVFALGSVMYHAATGTLPFPGRSFPEVCMAILDGNPKRPTLVRPSIPRALEDFIQKCMSRDPQQRYASGSAAHGALLAVSESLRLTGGVESAVTLRGAVFLMPLALVNTREGARLLASGLRRDLKSTLERGTALEVTLVESESLPATDKDVLALRGSLDWQPPSGTLEWVLTRVEEGGKEVELVRERVEHADADEWGLQAQLVGGTARMLKKRLGEHAYKMPAEQKREPARARTHILYAHDVMMRGTSRHLLGAISSFRRAIEADDSLALAHAGMAEALVRKFLYFDGDRTFLEEAQKSARRALVLQPECAEAHTSLGFALAVAGGHTAAQREYRISIQIDNKEWFAHRLLGAELAREGNFKAASPLLRRAIALRPTNIGSYDHLYCVLKASDRYEEALEIAERGIAAGRERLRNVDDDQDARVHLALLLARMGLADDARSTAQRARELYPKDGFTLFHAACVHAVVGDGEVAIELLRDAQARGYFLQSELQRNGDLDALRGEDGFQALARG